MPHHVSVPSQDFVTFCVMSTSLYHQGCPALAERGAGQLAGDGRCLRCCQCPSHKLDVHTDHLKATAEAGEGSQLSNPTPYSFHLLISFRVSEPSTSFLFVLVVAISGSYVAVGAKRAGQRGSSLQFAAQGEESQGSPTVAAVLVPQGLVQRHYWHLPPG